MHLRGRTLRRNLEFAHRTSLEPNAECDHRATGNGDILNQELDHALSLAVQDVRIIPQFAKVGSETKDALPLSVGKMIPLFGLAPVAFALNIIERAELPIPFGLQNIGHDAVVRMNLHEPLPGNLDLLLRPLYLLLVPLLHFLVLRLKLPLDLQGNLQCLRFHKLDNERTDIPVDAGARNTLTGSGSVLDGPPLAQIGGNQTALACSIADGHRIAASSANHQSLQESLPFPRRSAGAATSAVFGKAALIGLEPLPRDEAVMLVLQEHFDFIDWQSTVAVTAIRTAATESAAVYEGAGIAGIVKDLECL